MKRLFMSLGLSLCAVLTAQNENLLFAHAAKDGVPIKEKIPAGASVRRDSSELHLKFTRPGSLVYRVFITPDLGGRLCLSGEMRTENLKAGEKNWQNARIQVRFYNADGKQAGPWPRTIFLSGTASQKFSLVYEIPVHADSVLIEPSHLGKSGTVEYSSLRLTNPPANLLLFPNPDGVSKAGKIQKNMRSFLLGGQPAFMVEGPGEMRLNIPVSPRWKSLKLSMKMKGTGVRPGNASWQNARTAMRFYGKKGAVGPWPNCFQLSGTTEWINMERIYPVPEGARVLSFSPANYGISGTVEWKDVSLTIADFR